MLNLKVVGTATLSFSDAPKISNNFFTIYNNNKKNTYIFLHPSYTNKFICVSSNIIIIIIYISLIIIINFVNRFRKNTTTENSVFKVSDEFQQMNDKC